jgi:hypothetical protein
MMRRITIVSLGLGFRGMSMMRMVRMMVMMVTRMRRVVLMMRRRMWITMRHQA